MTYVTNSPAETEALGQHLAETLQPGDVIAYTGDLGAGKTAFTRGLARGLGITERITSPTFTIVNEYLGGRLPLFHFDMYRLGSSEELYEIGGAACAPWSGARSWRTRWRNLVFGWISARVRQKISGRSP